MSLFAVYASPIGYIRIEHRLRRVTLVQILESRPTDLGCADDYSDMIYHQIEEYLAGHRRLFDVEVDISLCTPFQQRVLTELCNIPYGETRSYRDIATAIGNPKASRAVGMANNRNPIAIIIPCHRVIGSNGALVGYAGGVELKRHLLSLEGAL
ncbi:MAG: methylated-DNA--[protein]-cysteine S-methyltransferase [Rikenellaceae bacterium]